MKWSDGVTTESRTDKLTSDITVTAIFEKTEPIETEEPTDSGKPDEPEAPG